MKREDLKAKGLTDEQIDFVMAENGKEVEANKAKLTTVETERDSFKNQLTDANKQIEGFKGMKTQAEVDAAVAEYKTKADQAQKDAEKQVADIKFDVALKDALKEFKVKDPEDVIPRLKRDAIKLGEDGKFIGLKEQIDPLKTAKGYLFEVEEGDGENKPPTIVTGGGNPSTGAQMSKLEAAMYKGAGMQPPKE